MLKKLLAKARSRDPVESYHEYRARNETPPPSLSAKMGDLELRVDNRKAAVGYLLEAVDGYLAQDNATMAQECLANAVRAQGHLTPGMLERRIRLAIVAEDWAEAIRQLGHARQAIPQRAMATIEAIGSAIEDAPYAPPPVMAAMGEFLQAMRRPEEGVRFWRQALDLAEARGEKTLVDELRRRIELATSDDRARHQRMASFIGVEVDDPVERVVPVAQPTRPAIAALETPKDLEDLLPTPVTEPPVRSAAVVTPAPTPPPAPPEVSFPEPLSRPMDPGFGALFVPEEEEETFGSGMRANEADVLAEITEEMDAIANSLGPLDIGGLIAALGNPAPPTAETTRPPRAGGFHIPGPPTPQAPEVVMPTPDDPPSARAVAPSPSGLGAPQEKPADLPPPTPMPTSARGQRKRPGAPKPPSAPPAAVPTPVVDTPAVPMAAAPTPAAPRPTGITLGLPLQTVTPGTPEQESITQLVTALREGLDAQAEAMDAGTHYDLGVMFLGMGLYAEAAREMVVALRDPMYRDRAAEFVVRCHLTAGSAPQAFMAGELLLEESGEKGVRGKARLAVMYWTGRAAEAAGKPARARELYREIAREDVAFEDVATRLMAEDPRPTASG